jgi:hypothetical protein
MTVPGYTAGSTLHRTGTAYISVAVRAGTLAGMVVTQQDPCAISPGGPCATCTDCHSTAAGLCFCSGSLCGATGVTTSCCATGGGGGGGGGGDGGPRPCCGRGSKCCGTCEPLPSGKGFRCDDVCIPHGALCP